MFVFFFCCIFPVRAIKEVPWHQTNHTDWWWTKFNSAWKYWKQASSTNDVNEIDECTEKGNNRMSFFWKAHDRYASLCPSLKRLIENVCNPDPNLRYTIKDCLNHPWIKNQIILTKLQLKDAMIGTLMTRNKEHTSKMQEIGEMYKSFEEKGQDIDGDDKFEFDQRFYYNYKNKTFDKNIILENSALFCRSRFKFLSNKSLKMIVETIHNFWTNINRNHNNINMKFDDRLCQFSISCAAIHMRTAKNFKNRSHEDNVSFNIRIIDKKNIDFDICDTINSNTQKFQPCICQADSDDDSDKKCDNCHDQCSTNESDTNDNENSFFIVIWRTEGHYLSFMVAISRLFYTNEKICGLVKAQDCSSSKRKPCYEKKLSSYRRSLLFPFRLTFERLTSSIIN